MKIRRGHRYKVPRGPRYNTHTRVVQDKRGVAGRRDANKQIADAQTPTTNPRGK